MNTHETSSHPQSESIVPVTTDREAHSKRWIAALVQSCLEKKVGERLDKLGVENYIPTQTVIRQWSDRKKKIERVVIPMIVFIRTDEMTERRLRMQTYIRKILSYPGQWKAAVIPDAQIDRLKFMLRHAESSVELLEQTLVPATEDIRNAKILVAGGAGIGSKENFALLEQLAQLLGGQVAASRAAVDAGFAPWDRQVGQTGHIVTPKLYIALGISGSIQHIMGMHGADRILAVNTDPKAPIFDYADVAVCADWKPLVEDWIHRLTH